MRPASLFFVGLYHSPTPLSHPFAHEIMADAPGPMADAPGSCSWSIPGNGRLSAPFGDNASRPTTHTCQNATRPFTSSVCSHSRGPVRCRVGEPGSASRGRCPTVDPEDRAGVRSGAL